MVENLPPGWNMQSPALLSSSSNVFPHPVLVQTTIIVDCVTNRSCDQKVLELQKPAIPEVREFSGIQPICGEVSGIPPSQGRISDRSTNKVRSQHASRLRLTGLYYSVFSPLVS